jgi:prepilin-type processing-associated H-X9-DG protein
MLYVTKSIQRELNRPDAYVTTVNTMVFSSNHAGGAQFAMADGSCRYVKQSIVADVLKAFASINTREMPVSLD